MAGDEQNVNLVTLDLILQRYPGTTGTDADRAIAGIPWKLTLNGVVSEGKTGADGKVHLSMPANGAGTLEMMGTTYAVGPAALDGEATLKGVRRRLQGLGYELGTVDGVEGIRTGIALLQFQADNNLDTLGEVTHADTQNALKAQFGE